MRQWIKLVEDATSGSMLRTDSSGDDRSLAGDHLFEMANLVQSQTGIPGVIYISTMVPGHDARMKYFQKTSKGQPSFSVLISANPQVSDNSLAIKVFNKMSPLVIQWVAQNHVSLLSFWNDGENWTDPQVTSFKASLTPYTA